MSKKTCVRSSSLRYVYRRQKVIAILLSGMIALAFQPVKTVAYNTSIPEVQLTLDEMPKELFEEEMANDESSILPQPTTGVTCITSITSKVTTTTTTKPIVTSVETTNSIEETTTDTTIVEEYTIEDVEEEWEEPEEEPDKCELTDEETVEDDFSEEIFIENVSDLDFIRICNAVASEAGSDWIPEYDKAKVVEVIMNRIKDPEYPDNVFDVILNGFQYSESYIYETELISEVTDSVISSVYYYFNNLEQYQHGYLTFYGNGEENIFS